MDAVSASARPPGGSGRTHPSGPQTLASTCARAGEQLGHAGGGQLPARPQPTSCSVSFPSLLPLSNFGIQKVKFETKVLDRLWGPHAAEASKARDPQRTRAPYALACTPRLLSSLPSWELAVRQGAEPGGAEPGGGACGQSIGRSPAGAEPWGGAWQGRSLAGAEPEAPLPPQSPAGLAQKRLWDAHAVTRPLGGTKDRRRPGHLTRASCRGRHPTAPHRGRFRSSTLHRFLIPPTLFYSFFFF